MLFVSFLFPHNVLEIDLGQDQKSGIPSSVKQNQEQLSQ